MRNENNFHSHNALKQVNNFEKKFENEWNLFVLLYVDRNLNINSTSAQNQWNGKVK